MFKIGDEVRTPRGSGRISEVYESVVAGQLVYIVDLTYKLIRIACVEKDLTPARS